MTGTEPDSQIPQGILNDWQPIESLADIAYRWRLVPRETHHVQQTLDLLTQRRKLSGCRRGQGAEPGSQDDNAAPTRPEPHKHHSPKHLLQQHLRRAARIIWAASPC